MITLSVTRSWNEYSRCVLEPWASTEGHEIGPGPVVQLSIADADDPADVGNPIALLAHDSSVITTVSSKRRAVRRPCQRTCAGPLKFRPAGADGP